MPVLVQTPSKPEPGGGGYGYTQHVVLDPRTVDRLIAAGDVWGAPISEDAGATWSRHEQGVYDHNQLNVAGISFSRFTADRVYYATTSGIMVSTDGGRTKSLLTSAVTFLGNANVPTAYTGVNHPPRSNGHLIDDDPRDGVMVAGHGSDGVWTNVSGSWVRIALTGAYVRNVWIDPMDPDVLWVAVFDGVVTGGSTFNGLYRIDAWRTTPVVTRTSLTPRSVNKIAFSDADSNTIDAFCDADGVWKSLDHGWTWTRIGVGSGTALVDGVSRWAAGRRRSPDVGTLPLRRSTTDVFYDASDPTNTDKTLEWFAPPTGENNPILLTLHGGGGNVGDKANLHSTPFSGDMVLRFAAAGFSVVNINYVLGGGVATPANDFPAGLDSLKLALAWVKANAATIHGDATKIGVFGGSAGATYAQMLGLGDWQSAVEDTFNAADTTSINGRTTTTGSKTWVSPTVTTTFGISGNALKYTGTVDGTTRLARASVDVASASGDILRYKGLTLAATRNRGGPHFNSTDTTQNPAHDLQIEYRKNSGTSSWFIYHRRLGGTLDTLATIAADGTHAPVFALGAKIDIEINRRRWPWIMVRAKLSTSPESQWQVVCHLNLADSTANTTNGTGVGIDLVADGSLTALAAATVIGYQGIYGTTSPNADGGATLDDIQVLTHVDLLPATSTILSASGYADLRVGPPHSPLASFETIMLGWFGVDDQSGAGQWFTVDPADGTHFIQGTFDPAKPRNRTNLARMMAGSTIFGMDPAVFYYDPDTGNASNDWTIDPNIQNGATPVHLFGSTNETCPLFQQTTYYAALNAAGRNHYDGSLAEYASVASPRDTKKIFTGTNHADYPGVFDMYVNILRRDLGVVNAPATDILVMGCGNPQAPTGSYQALWRSPDGGTTLVCVTDPADTHVPDVVLGTTGAWWGGHTWMLGRGSIAVSSVQIDPNHPGRWFLSTGTGVLRSDDDGVTWTMTVNGLESTGGNVVVAHPSLPGLAYTMGTDLAFAYSSDHLQTLTKVPPANVPLFSGNPHDLRIADDGRFYFAGNAGSTGTQTNGGVSSAPNFSDGSWVDEGYNAAAGGTSSKAVRGLGVMLDGSGNRILIALTAGDGIWRGVRAASASPGATWTHMTVPTGAFGTAQIGKYAIVWNNATGLVFGYDPTGALYRSRDFGVTWETFWTGVNGNGERNDLALDGTTLYVSGPNGLFRITGADQSGKTVDNAQLTADLVLAGPSAGVTADPTSHLISTVTRSTATDAVRFMRSVDAGATWLDLSTPELKEVAVDTRAMAFTSDGYLLTAQPGFGWSTGFYGAVLPPPPTTNPIFRAIDTDEFRTGETSVLVDLLEVNNGAAYGWKLLADLGSGQIVDADVLLRQDGVPGAIVAQLTDPEEMKQIRVMGKWPDVSSARAAIQTLGTVLRNGGTWMWQPAPELPVMYLDALPSPRAKMLLGQVSGAMGDLDWVVNRLMSPNGVPIPLKCQPYFRGARLTSQLALTSLTNEAGRRVAVVNNPGTAESLLVLRVQPTDPATPLQSVTVWRRSKGALSEWAANFSSYEVETATLGDARNTLAVVPAVMAEAGTSGGSFVRFTFNQTGTWRLLRKKLIPGSKDALAGTFKARLFVRGSAAIFTIQQRSGLYDDGNTPPVAGGVHTLDGTGLPTQGWTVLDLGAVDFDVKGQAIVQELWGSCDTPGQYLDVDVMAFAPADELWVAAAIPGSSPIAAAPPGVDTWSPNVADGQTGTAPGCKDPAQDSGKWVTAALNQGVSPIPWQAAITGLGDHDVWVQPGYQVNSPPSFSTRMGYLRMVRVGQTIRIWAPGLTTTTDEFWLPTVPNGHIYRTKNPGPGVTGSTEPVWPTGFGANVTQDGVTYAEATLFDGSGNAVQAPLSAPAGQQFSTATDPIHVSFTLTDPAFQVIPMIIQTQPGQGDGAPSARKIFIPPFFHTFVPAPSSGSPSANQFFSDAYEREAYAADPNGVKMFDLRSMSFMRLAPGDDALFFEFGTTPVSGLDQFDASDPDLPGIQATSEYDVEGDVIPLYAPADL